MEDEVEILQINSKLQCKVCGEKEFEEREGFYYCQECGTKQEQVRLVEVERGEDFTNEKRAKKQKIHTAKAEELQLTSWECYNYILRGFVEELLCFGAKEELKLMTLQVWAAYLRCMEVAFFSRKQPDLPRLGVKYYPNDAKTIYNHTVNVRKKRKRKRTEDNSCTSGGESMSGRDWRRSKRKLEESTYSLTSATSGASSDLTSSTSANSNKAIKLAFNTKARKFLKKKMPVKHLEKHQLDAEGKLTCHKQPRVREIKSTDYSMMLMNVKQIYCVLAISLNLVNDEIQLSDLVRFIHEGHIGTSNVLQYFPENIANRGKEILRKINFYKCPDKYSDKALRDHIAVMSKSIGIYKFKTPDIIKLVRRYVSELCLPTSIGDYIQRLVNFLPPKFDTRSAGAYPNYEARAMAYIIFVLKLIYGLDGCKEHRMSEASRKLNNEIKQLNQKNGEKQPLLFVWNDWVQYIEMRKVIISYFNSSFCDQFKQCQSSTQLIERMEEEIRRTEERDNLQNDTIDNNKSAHRLQSFKQLFERFQENFKSSDETRRKSTYIEFKPSFTSGLSYLKSILLFCDSQDGSNADSCFKIPDFMRTDHSQRDINSYLQVKPLIAYFNKYHKELKVHIIPTNPNSTFVGTFRAPRTVSRGTEAINIRLQKACFKITEEEWAENVAAEVVNSTDDLEFKTDFELYHDRYYYNQQCRKKKTSNLFDPRMNYDLTKLLANGSNDQNDNMTTSNLPKTTSLGGNEILSVHSFEIFSENNMDPMQTDFIKEPRRDLDSVDLFEGISDEESVLNKDDNSVPNRSSSSMNNNNDTLLKSQESISSQELSQTLPDCLEEFIKEGESTTEQQIKIKKELNDSITKNSKQNDKVVEDNVLKFYISNMDNWMLLGNILMLTKGQRTQLQDKFPRSFTWLLETCAQTLNMEWSAVYEQLLCIEVMFCLGIENPNDIKDCIYFKSLNPIKDHQMLVNTYREIW